MITIDADVSDPMRFNRLDQLYCETGAINIGRPAVLVTTSGIATQVLWHAKHLMRCIERLNLSPTVLKEAHVTPLWLATARLAIDDEMPPGTIYLATQARERGDSFEQWRNANVLGQLIGLRDGAHIF